MDTSEMIRQNIRDTEAKLNAMRTKLRETEEAEKNSDFASDEERQLAILLHTILCVWNHNDGCSWGYENWETPLHRTNSHKEYVTKARAMLKVADDTNTTFATLIALMDSLPKGNRLT